MNLWAPYIGRKVTTKVTILDLLAREGKLPYREHWRPVRPEQREPQPAMFRRFGCSAPVILPPGWTIGFTPPGDLR